MMEVTIHWSCISGDSLQRYLVDVKSDGKERPNPFDAKQANAAIDIALRAFRDIPPLKSDGIVQERCITRIDLRQTEDRCLVADPRRDLAAFA